jgi:probable F420-dependent oxidoreductase
MRFGTRLYGTDPEDVVGKAVLAEELGFESVWRGDHYLLPAEITTDYPNLPGGKPPFTASAPVLDVLMVLSYVAHATSRIRLATGVFVLPLRDPVQVARAVQTLDVLSNGRTIFGCGLGWMAEEFEFAGIPFASRGAIATESIQVVKALWTQAEPAFAGKHFTLSNCRFEPKPPQGSHLPIVIGGESEAGLRRAATLGDGWYGHRPTPRDAAERIARLRALRRDCGRADENFEVTVRANPDTSTETIHEFEEVGVDRIVLEVGDFADSGPSRDATVMRRFAERVFPSFT